MFREREVADALRTDLVLRGRSLGGLGASLRWSDLLAVIKSLPEDSNFRRALSASPQSNQSQSRSKKKPATASEMRARVAASMRKAE